MSDDEVALATSRAEAALALRRPEEARRLLAPLLASHPDDATASALMAVASAECGEPPVVWRRFADRAAALAPSDATLLATLADLGRTAGDPGAGLYYAQRALQIDPNHVLALNVLALLQIDSNPKAALATIDRAMALSPETPEIMVARGMALGSAGQLAASQAMYVAALRENPRQLSALNNLAVSRLLCADLPRASRLLHRAVAEDPHTALYRSNLDVVGATTRALTIAALMIATNVYILMSFVNQWLGTVLAVSLAAWVVISVIRLPVPVLRRLGRNRTVFDLLWLLYLVLAVPLVMSVAAGETPSLGIGLFVWFFVGLRLVVPFVVRRVSVAFGLRALGVRLP